MGTVQIAQEHVLPLYDCWIGVCVQNFGVHIFVKESSGCPRVGFALPNQHRPEHARPDMAGTWLGKLTMGQKMAHKCCNASAKNLSWS